jgi:hypothetical protein
MKYLLNIYIDFDEDDDPSVREEVCKFLDRHDLMFDVERLISIKIRRILDNEPPKPINFMNFMYKYCEKKLYTMKKEELLEIIKECEEGSEGLCPICGEVVSGCEGSYSKKDESGFYAGHAENCKLARALNEGKDV